MEEMGEFDFRERKVRIVDSGRSGTSGTGEEMGMSAMMSWWVTRFWDTVRIGKPQSLG